jgi:23S rRNA pseudouridine1911/1915/1917 synthase
MATKAGLKLFVQSTEKEVRLDKYIQSHFPEYSRSFLQKMIQQGFITVNQKPSKSSYYVSYKDEVQIMIPDPGESDIQAEDIKIDIIYEDNDILIVDKPAGLVVHPGAGIKNGTLVNALLYHTKMLAGIGTRKRPGIIHRLDKNTSGLLIVAKNEIAYLALSRQLAERQIIREYLALVWHQFKDSNGRIETFLNRSKRDRTKFAVSNSGKKAITQYEVQRVFNFLTLLKLKLETGRTHQIRAHLNYIHHPVFGDPDYHGRHKQISQLNRQQDKQFAQELLKMISHQTLHAYHLQFEHPTRKEMVDFVVKMPKDFDDILKKLAEDEKL